MLIAAVALIRQLQHRLQIQNKRCRCKSSSRSCLNEPILILKELSVDVKDGIATIYGEVKDASCTRQRHNLQWPQ